MTDEKLVQSPEDMYGDICTGLFVLLLWSYGVTSLVVGHPLKPSNT